MDYGSPLLEQLVKRLTRLPGIGERSAQRIALHLLHAPASDSEELARLLRVDQADGREVSAADEEQRRDRNDNLLGQGEIMAMMKLGDKQHGHGFV